MRFETDIYNDCRDRDTALVLVDLQHGFMSECTNHLVSRVGRFLEEHADDFAVIIATRFLNQKDSPYERVFDWHMMMTKPDIDLIEKVNEYSDIVLDKTTYLDADDIARELDQRGLHRVALAGVDTDVCVALNAGALFDRGFTVDVLYDLCASGGGSHVHDAMLEPLRRIIGPNHVIIRMEDSPIHDNGLVRLTKAGPKRGPRGKEAPSD